MLRLNSLARVLEGWSPNEMLMKLFLFLSAHIYYATESCTVL